MSIRPNTLGGMISVANSAELATLDVTGLPPGTLVYNMDPSVKKAFRLTTCERRTIDIDPDTDSYDGAGEWVLAGGEFVASDVGCTAIVVAEFPNGALDGVWEIETVTDGETIVTNVVSDHEPVGVFAGTLVVFDNALVINSVVAVLGTFESRWIVETVTDVEHADLADLADLATLAIAASGPDDAAFFTGTLNEASEALKGLMSTADKTKLGKFFSYGQASDLADSDATIAAGTDKKGQYVMRAGTTTAIRNLTMSTAGASQAFTVDFVILAQGHNVMIKAAGGGTLFTVPAGDAVRCIVYFNAGNFIMQTWGYL